MLDAFEKKEVFFIPSSSIEIYIFILKYVFTWPLVFYYNFFGLY